MRRSIRALKYSYNIQKKIFFYSFHVYGKVLLFFFFWLFFFVLVHVKE